ncbi:MAG: hypothetical protein ACFB2X_17890 [Rivularia sp. (in: cyanobacteria)]
MYFIIPEYLFVKQNIPLFYEFAINERGTVAIAPAADFSPTLNPVFLISPYEQN